MRDFYQRLGRIIFKQYILVEVRKTRKNGKTMVCVHVMDLGLTGCGRTFEEACDNLEEKITEILYEGKDEEKIRLIEEFVEMIGGD